MRGLVGTLVAEAAGSTVATTVRQIVDKVAEISDGDRTFGDGVTVAAVAGELRLERSAAIRRLRAARDRGRLVNLEAQKGPPARPAELVHHRA